MPRSSPVPEAYCLSCGYRLDTFADPPRCPECGRGFDPNDPATVRTPGPRDFRPQMSWPWVLMVLFAFLTLLFLLGELGLLSGSTVN